MCEGSLVKLNDRNLVPSDSNASSTTSGHPIQLGFWSAHCEQAATDGLHDGLYETKYDKSRYIVKGMFGTSTSYCQLSITRSPSIAEAQKSTIKLKPVTAGVLLFLPKEHANPHLADRFEP